MPEINFPDGQPARPLFHTLERSHALVTACFEGCATARLFVDNIETPQASILVCNSRVLCAGNPSQAEFNDEMTRLFADDLVPAHIGRGNDAYLVYVSSDAWGPTVEYLFPTRDLYHGMRQYYELSDFTSSIEPSFPEGFSVHLITPEFLASGVNGLGAVQEEMCSERASVEEFLARSFGICPVYENEIAGWCMSEYNVGNRCEIGIATAPNHQRKGIATAATLSFLAEAHRRGYSRVGWDCWVRNEGSVATARKAGFQLVEEYSAVIVEL